MTAFATIWVPASRFLAIGREISRLSHYNNYSVNRDFFGLPGPLLRYLRFRERLPYRFQ